MAIAQGRSHAQVRQRDIEFVNMINDMIDHTIFADEVKNVTQEWEDEHSGHGWKCPKYLAVDQVCSLLCFFIQSQPYTDCKGKTQTIQCTGHVLARGNPK